MPMGWVADNYEEIREKIKDQIEERKEGDLEEI